MTKQTNHKHEVSKTRDRSESNVSPSSSESGISVVSAGNYAPSPNTCNQALIKANQHHLQTILRQILTSNDPHRLDLMKLLRKLLRELNYQLGWLAQTDLLEAIERLMREENERETDWRLLNDSTLLLIDGLPKFAIEPDWESLEQILASAIENLGHQKSELRRSSLLLINSCIHRYSRRPIEYRRLVRLFIERGLANVYNEQAQRGAILSLPLILTKQTVEGHDFQPLVSCLADLLVGAQSRLFYSLYLALQHLQHTLGDKQFARYLDLCPPEARILYKQAASRTNSLVSNQAETPVDRFSDDGSGASGETSNAPALPSRQVTFDKAVKLDGETTNIRRASQGETKASHQSTEYPENYSSVDSKPQNDETQPEWQEDTTLNHASPTLSESSNGDRQSTLNWQASASTDVQTAQGSRGELNFSSDVSSTCSSDAHLVNPAHYMNEPALNGNPLDGLRLLPPHHLDHEDNLAINQLGVCCSPTVEVGVASKNELRFGIFPRHLVQVALSPVSSSRNQQQNRLDALNEMMCMIRDSPINHLAILVTYLDPFIDQFLSRLVEPSTDYRSGLVAIDMIETIVIKTKLSTLQFVRPLIQILVKALADSRSLYRDNTIRVIHKMMAYLPPQHVIDALFEHKHHRNPVVREQLVDRVTGAILNYDRQEFNLTKLCYHVLPMLADHHANVRLASLECIASLANALGPERIGTLLTAAEAVQTGCDYDGLLDAIYARLKRRALPRCNSDGSIKHLIRPFLSSSHAQFHQEHRAADVRWVMEAPSSHQHLHEHHVASTADNDHHVHAHRPGVYSPTVAAEMSRSRRLSIGQEPEKHHAHHHAKHHHHSSHSSSSGHQDGHSDANRHFDDEPGKTKEFSEQPIDSNRRQSESQIKITRRLSQQQQVSRVANSESKISDRKLNSNSENPVRNRSKSECRSSGVIVRPKIEDQKGEPDLRRGAKFRSESRESSSSVDSDKVLFQYYLTKFKQSLINQSSNNGFNSMSVLPSDSIIYTDAAQVYALSRQQSRQQQTSFDYDSNSGQIPIDKSNPSNELEKSLSERSSRHASRTSNELLLGQSKIESAEKRADSRPQQTKSLDQGRRQSTRRRRSQEMMERQNSWPEVSNGQVDTEENSQITTMKETQASRRKYSVSSGRESLRKVQTRNQSRDGSAEVKTERQSDSDGLSKLNSESRERESIQNEPKQHQVVTNDEDPELKSSGRRRQSSSRSLDRRQSTVQDEDTISQQTLAGEQDSAISSINEGPQTIDDHEQDDQDVIFQADRRESTVKSEREGRERRSRSRMKANEQESATSESGSGSGELRQRMARSQPPRRSERHMNQDPGKQTRRLRRTSGKTNHSEVGEGSDSTNSGGARRAISVSPGSINGSVNIRHILENVAQVEGQFKEPQLAFRVAMDALNGNCWSTKVEGILALIRLASHHPQVLAGHQRELVGRVADETRNLRSTVARSAIFALGDFCGKLGRSIESDLDTIVQALLHKSIENTAFIRDDIRRAFTRMLDHITHWRLATSLMNHGANHKNLHVRRMASQFIAALVKRMGAAKCLVGAKDISSQLLPAAAKFAQDGSPHTRYYGRLILYTTMQHGAFDRLMRKTLTPSLYRGSIGIIESVKRRGPGEPPAET